MPILRPALRAQLLRRVAPWRMGLAWPHYAWNALLARWAHHIGRGPRPVRVLIVGDAASYTSDQQFAPLGRFHRALRRRLGHVFLFRFLRDEALRLPGDADKRWDAILCKFDFRTPDPQAVAAMRGLRARADAAGVPLVYFDGDDDQLPQWREVVRLSDLFVRKHAFADRRLYERGFIGRSNLTDHLARTVGMDFSGDAIPFLPALARADADKIRVSWNLALDDKIVRLANRLARQPQPAWAARSVDVMCRASQGQAGSFLHAFRAPALQAMQRLQGRFEVLAPLRHVDQDEYYREMLRSRLCVSPFGYGEICWRDFEAVLCGCLLLKPDMSHVETEPDIFRAGETYVPLRWDYADLEDQVRHYLDHPQEAERIIANARRAVLDAQREDDFVLRYGRLMAEVLPSAARVAAAPGAAMPSGRVQRRGDDTTAVPPLRGGRDS